MSNRGRYIVEAIVVEHRSPSELARTHKVSRSWIYKLLERFEKGGYASLAALATTSVVLSPGRGQSPKADHQAALRAGRGGP